MRRKTRSGSGGGVPRLAPVMRYAVKSVEDIIGRESETKMRVEECEFLNYSYSSTLPSTCDSLIIHRPGN